MTKKHKKTLAKIILAIFLDSLTFIPFFPTSLKLIIFTTAFLIAGGTIFKKSLHNIRNGQIFDENFLMSIASISAFILEQYQEALAVVLFFQIGELFESHAVNQSRQSIRSLINMRPHSANKLQNGEIIKVTPEEVSLNDTIIIYPGERVPLDGVIIEGSSTLDTSALTGESLPREVFPQDDINSGCINLNGILHIRTTKVFEDSTVTKILNLIENSSIHKAKVENFITRFARWYTPCVVCIAVALAVFMPLLTHIDFQTWLYRAITFLVISCPCALVISVPLSFFGGIGAASKCGILFKGSNTLESLSQVSTLVFDKTGTLTKGNFKIVDIQSPLFSHDELLEKMALIEAFSSHPIAQSIKQAYGKKMNHHRLKNVEELGGLGLKATLDKQQLILGSAHIMALNNIAIPSLTEDGTHIFLAIDSQYVGHITIADEIKEDSYSALQELKKLGLTHLVMLTGDREKIGKKVAQQLNISDVHTELLPADKVQKVEELRQHPLTKGNLAFIGDGINDAPVLAQADVGIAMGGIGSDSAVEVADIVIMTDEISKIPTALKIARKTIHIARENIVFSLFVKFLVLGLGAWGYASIWAAIFADVGVSVIAILNAIRTLTPPQKNQSQQQ